MRHRDARTRLKQKPAHARMLKRNLVTSLLLYESIRTTKTRAKAVQPIVDRLITIAKKKPAHVAIRAINQVVTDKNASKKIMEVYTKRFDDRASGLTRIVPAGARVGDGAHLVDISLVEGKEVVLEEKEPTKKPAAKKPAAKTEKKPAAKKATPKKDK